MLIGPKVTDTAFHHYSYTRSGDTHKLFMDGVEVTGDTFTGSPGDTSGIELAIGALRHDSLPGGFCCYFGGIIDEVEIFNRALSEAEIRSIFKAGPAGKIKPQPVEPPAGMVSWWPGDGHAMDIIDGNGGALQNGATFADGKVSHAFSLDGVDDFVLVPDSPNLNITGDVTVDLWAKRTSFGAISFLIAKGGGVIGGVDVPTAYLLGFNPSDELRASFELADGSGVDLTAQVVVDDAFHHYAYVRGGNTHELFIDGVLVTGGTFTGIPGDTSGLPLVIGGLRTDSDPTGFESHFVGLIDEIEIFNRALTADEIRGIFEAGSAGKVKPPPDPVEPPAGMVSWWPGDGNANDIIGVNDGVLSGDASFAPGKVGQAFSFDGTGDFVEVPHSANMNLAQFSVDTWVFIDPVVNAGQFNAFVGKSDGSTVGGGFWLAHDARNEAGFPVTEDALHFTVNGGPSGASDAFLKNSVPESGFYHLTGTFDGSQARLYINGSLVATGPAIPGIAFNTFPLRIGAINLKERTGIDDRFEGLIDEVELFNRALTEAEIWAIFKAGPAGKRKPQPVEPPAGMVSWWSADGHAMDIVDGNDGALQNGATFADGKVGHAFSLDGVDDRAVVPHSGDLNINGAVTLDAWIKPDSLACPGGWCAVVAKSDVSNVKRNYGLWVRSNGQLWLSYINTGGAERLLASAAGTITIGTFQHVAGVIDTVSGTMRVFKNGVEMGSAPASGAMAVNTEPLTIGLADPGIGNDFNGLIDEVEIFNRALSEAEIRSIFDSGREGKIKPPLGPLEPPAGMVSWWPGDGNALDIEDGNDGALSGDATFTGGMVGQAFRFDGTGDFVEIPDSANLDITESITVDVWINQRSRSPEAAPIVSKWNDKGGCLIDWWAS